jgi:N6-adenosine-specific RNA methylase IME4
VIFCPEKPASIESPDEIYEIGDLMMPGARKLEIGFKEFGGWFTLKHREESFARCHQCLRKDRRMLFYTADKEIKCEYCLIYNLKQQKQE